MSVRTSRYVGHASTVAQAACCRTASCVLLETGVHAVRPPRTGETAQSSGGKIGLVQTVLRGSVFAHGKSRKLGVITVCEHQKLLLAHIDTLTHAAPVAKEAQVIWAVLVGSTDRRFSERPGYI